MNKPQDYYGILLHEESFSDYFDCIYSEVTEHMTSEEIGHVRELAYRAYKEGYMDALEKVMFLMK